MDNQTAVRDMFELVSKAPMSQRVRAMLFEFVERADPEGMFRKLSSFVERRGDVGRSVEAAGRVSFESVYPQVEAIYERWRDGRTRPAEAVSTAGGAAVAPTIALADNERRELEELRDRVTRLAAYLQSNGVPGPDAPPSAWYALLAGLKDIQGNASNDLSRVAAVMARAYLVSKLPMRPFDALAKAQGAPGLDIDERTMSGARVIGEIKTTTPYQPTDLGAAQKRTFEEDFAKLNREQAEHKFFFVTEDRTFDLMRRKYAQKIPGVRIVQLITGEEFVAPRGG